ncbi:hypothetical protein M0R04_10325 [Candidatus Dojkabacteria bacterium]|jgi:hypothetical protein|nr:hypothetical protein [Candidatus Dojkabacteria bacterium]
MNEIIEERPYKKSWEEYVTLLQNAREVKDDSQWTAGDLALGVEKDYGEDALGKAAYAGGYEKKTLMNYRTIAKRFPSHIRDKYKKLSWSHFSSVSAEKIPQPEAWLEKADDEDWSVETLRKQVNEAYPSVGSPRLDDNPPEVIRCDECGKWKLKDTSTLEICRGHYGIQNGEMVWR